MARVKLTHSYDAEAGEVWLPILISCGKFHQVLQVSRTIESHPKHGVVHERKHIRLNDLVGSADLFSKSAAFRSGDANCRRVTQQLCLMSTAAWLVTKKVNDAERLWQDPTLRLIGSEKIWERGAALTSRLRSFETELLAQEENLAGLEVINRDLIARAESVESEQGVVLDMDTTEIPVYDRQDRRAVDRNRFRCRARLEKEKCLRNRLERRQFLALGFCRGRRRGSAQKAWLEHCLLTGSDVEFRSSGKSKRKFR